MAVRAKRQIMWLLGWITVCKWETRSAINSQVKVPDIDQRLRSRESETSDLKHLRVIFLLYPISSVRCVQPIKSWKTPTLDQLKAHTVI